MKLRLAAIPVVALLVLAGTTAALAIRPDEMLANPKLEERARTIDQELRCLVCQNQSIDESDADLAHDLRLLVRQRLLAGDSNDEAKHYIVARYGDYVLLKPPFDAETYLLWFGPVILLLAGSAAAFVFYRRLAAEKPQPLSPEDAERVAALIGETEEKKGMTMLWFVFIALILVSIAVLLAPFMKAPASETPLRADYDIVVYRSQLAEIDQEIERGLLTADQADAARAEVHRRMLVAEDAELERPLQPKGLGRARLAAAIALAVVLPLGAAALYGVLGSPSLPGKPYAWRLQHDPEFVSASTAEKLASLLQESPSAAGYKRLGEMYFDARNYEQSAAAVRRAVELGASDAGTWSELGESVVMANEGAVVPEALMAFVNTLGTDPKNARARFYVGLAESQIGNLKEAVGIMRDLEKDSDPNAAWLPLVREHIAALSKQGGFDPASVPPSPPSLRALNVALKAMTNALHIQSTAGAPAAAQAAPPDNVPPTAGSNDRDTMIRAMVASFAAKMEKNPSDVNGWQRLAHFYIVLGEPDKARGAVEHAVRLKPNDVGVLLSLAETQKASAAPGDEAPSDYVDTMRKVLKHDPANVEALYAAGLAEEKAGHHEKAHFLWNKALKAAAASDPLAITIRARLDRK